jgi:hypothetical protein
MSALMMMAGGMSALVMMMTDMTWFKPPKLKTQKPQACRVTGGGY